MTNPIPATLETITPAAAAALIDNAHPGRAPNLAVIAAHAEAMRDKTWDPNKLRAVTIALDPAGRLVAGQHPLRAVIEAGVPAQMFVIRQEQPHYPVPELAAELDVSYGDPGEIVRAKGVMDGAESLAEAAQMLRSFAMYIQGLHDQGYTLDGPVEDDYGHLVKPGIASDDEGTLRSGQHWLDGIAGGP